MKAAHDLSFSHEGHQEIASGITSLAQDLQMFSIEPWGMSGEAKRVPLDRRAVALDQRSLGEHHFNADLTYAVSPEIGKTATISLYGSNPYENTHLFLAGDNEAWDIARGDRSNVVGSLSHTAVIHYMAGVNRYKHPENLSDGKWFTDKSALLALVKIMEPARQQSVHTASVSHLDSTGITTVGARLLTVRRPYATLHALSLENDFTIAVPDSDFDTGDVTKRYLYTLKQPRGRRQQAAAMVTLESSKIPTNLLGALAANEQEYEHTETVEKFQQALAMISEASMAELGFVA